MSGDVDAIREKLYANLRDIEGYDWALQNAADVAKRLSPLVAALVAAERERLALEIHVHRFDHDDGAYSGPDSFYAGMTHARLICGGLPVAREVPS